MPVERAQSRRARSARSWLPAASSETIRKSLPQAWALVKGINLPPNSRKAKSRRLPLRPAVIRAVARGGSLPDAITVYAGLLSAVVQNAFGMRSIQDAEK
jgi:hypothetical protein